MLIFSAFLGKYTYEIMAFHFLSFKIVDVIWYMVSGESNIEILASFPVSYHFDGIYIVVGCALPAFGKVLFDKVVNRAKRELL